MVIFHDFPSSHVSLFKGENSFQALRNVICGFVAPRHPKATSIHQQSYTTASNPPSIFLTFSKHMVDLQNPHIPQTPPPQNHQKLPVDLQRFLARPKTNKYIAATLVKVKRTSLPTSGCRPTKCNSVITAFVWGDGFFKSLG